MKERIESLIVELANTPVPDGSFNESATAILLYFMVIIFAMMIPVLFLMGIVTIIAMWRMFEKAGISGWLVLVPIYNVYVMYKHFWNVGAFKRLLALSIIYGVLSTVMEFIPNESVYLIIDYVVTAIYALIILHTFRFNYHLAKSFDRGFFFALGLTLLSPFFEWILGLGDCDYVGDAYDYYY